MRSVMEHSFAQVPTVDIPRSSFNRSHGHKTTLDADWLVPIFVDEVLPGDTFNMNCNFFCRLATPEHPILDNLYLETFWFFVPYRLLWTNWEKFCGAQDNPADTIAYTIPKVSSNTAFNVITGDALFDYMGLPYRSSVDMTEVSALPFRAYNKIFNDWFKDQNLINDEAERTGDGPDNTNDYNLYKRCKRHDYFTSALPWPQKGDSVQVPLGDAYVKGLAIDTGNAPTAGPSGNVVESGDLLSHQYSSYWRTDTDNVYIEKDPTYQIPYVRVDVEELAPTINEFRQAMQIQRLLERDARSGTRYVEMIKAHFGVTVPDFRLFRSEFLGGGSSRVNITPVAQTNFNGNVGDLGGFGTVGDNHGWTKSFVEHGVVLGLANVRGDITYDTGLERMWFRDTRFDFYYPVLSQLGEQVVYNKEIYYQNTAADDNAFGYQERYAEYRYKPSRLSGLFRNDHASTLNVWHLSENLAALPTLGASFIASNTGAPLDRAIAVPSEPHFICDFYFDLRCARPMPLFGVPGNLDHF